MFVHQKTVHQSSKCSGNSSSTPLVSSIPAESGNSCPRTSFSRIVSFQSPESRSFSFSTQNAALSRSWWQNSSMIFSSQVELITSKNFTIQSPSVSWSEASSYTRTLSSADYIFLEVCTVQFPRKCKSIWTALIYCHQLRMVARRARKGAAPRS